jgi:uncharacterized damage-inducible protein DinB
MKLRNITYVAIAFLAFAAHTAYAQTPDANPLSAGLKGSYTTIKNNIIKAAEKMPEEHFGFKPMPDMQSFGQRLGHIADASIRSCASVKGEQKTPPAGTKTAKAELIAALKETFTYCDSVVDSLTDADASKLASVGGRQSTKLQPLWGMVSHNNSIYGALSVYMRLKGVIPPSSEPR